MVIAALLSVPSLANTSDGEVACPPDESATQAVSRSEVYRDMPFQPGERAVYQVDYMGMRAGFGTFEVGTPGNNNGDWYRVFRVKAQTGDWYKAVYEGHGHVYTMSRPQDFGGRWMLLERSGRRVLSKWKTKRSMFEFGPEHCKVVERTVQTGKPEKVEEKPALPGTMDILSAAYFIRAHSFQTGQTERALLYHSGASNWLRIDPVGYETVTVPAGSYRALKLRAQAYRDDEPQAKGRFELWVADDHPNRPVVKADAEVKIGRVTLRLDEFSPGLSP